MNLSSFTHRGFRNHSIASTAILSLLASSVSFAASPPKDSPVVDPDREFRLFVGLNIEVKQANEFSTVDYYDDNRVSTEKLAEGLVSLRHVEGIRYTHSTKLSRNPITIGEISTEHGPSTIRAAQKAMRNHQILEDSVSDAMQAQWNALNGTGIPQVVNDSAPQSSAGTGLGDSLSSLSEAANNYSKIVDPSIYAEQVSVAKGTMPNALYITTQISSPVPIKNAYAVGFARLASEDGETKEVLFFKEIPQLGPNPRLLEITKAGLENDFKVQEVELHVYHRGRELVSDRSAKQFALTRAETLQYLANEREALHRGESLPAEPAWSLAPPSLLATTRPENLDFPVNVQVDATGEVTGIDRDVIVPPAVAEAVQSLLFLPALENGTAVASNVSVNLSDYFR